MTVRETISVCMEHRCWPLADDPNKTVCPLAEWEKQYSGWTADCRWETVELSVFLSSRRSGWGAGMTHGTLTGYVRHRCRCAPCTKANRDYGRRFQAARRKVQLTPEQRRHCLICGTALNVHPIRACWREIR